MFCLPSVFSQLTGGHELLALEALGSDRMGLLPLSVVVCERHEKKPFRFKYDSDALSFSSIIQDALTALLKYLWISF